MADYQPPDYERWDLPNQYTVEEAACLWCEIEPGIFPHGTRRKHPEIAAINRLIENAIREGNLTADTKHAALVMIGDYSKALVERSELRALAEEIGERPRFLFPEDRHERPAPSKGEIATATVILPRTADPGAANADRPRDAGRPTLKTEIQAAYKELREAGDIKFDAPKNRLYEPIRKKVRGLKGDPSLEKGLQDEAIRKVIHPLFEADKSARSTSP